MITRVVGPLGWTVLVLSLVFAACASPVGDDVVLATRPDGGGPAGATFIPPDAKDSGVDARPSPLLLCPSDRCPAPLATCSTSTYLCDVNTLTDNAHCGGCGNACAGAAPEISASFSCQNGTCVLACFSGTKDCDGILDNGCEVQLGTNDNCGGCGDKCPPGINCQGGKCGACAAPLILCAGRCVDPRSNDANCGGCGTVCPDRPAGSAPPPPHMYYGCSGSTCGNLKCDNREFPTEWTDCDKNIPVTGCEVDLSLPNDAHCGKCEIKCDPSKTCDVAAGSLIPTFSCLCGPNETNCGVEPETGYRICANLGTNPYNCGACGRVCPGTVSGPSNGGAFPHSSAVCRAGSCDIACDEGFADCNGYQGDGCEVDLKRDPANCGACGAKCQGGSTQACIEGRCAEEDCSKVVPK